MSRLRTGASSRAAEVQRPDVSSSDEQSERMPAGAGGLVVAGRRSVLRGEMRERLIDGADAPARRSTGCR